MMIMSKMISLCVVPLLVAVSAGSAQDTGLRLSSNWPSELMARIQDHGGHQPEIYSQALKVIEELRSSPSCIRLAVSTLVDTCQSLGTKGEHAVLKMDAELALDEVKSEFAARLAMCELAGARATLPEKCSILTPSSSACSRSRFGGLFGRSAEENVDRLCYSPVSDVQIKACLGALESRPQWWTSYSNARQNAVVICQASRDMIEKDNILGIYKDLTEAVSNLTATMRSSMQEHNTALEARKAYGELLVSVQNEAAKAFETGNQEAQMMLAKYLADMQTAFSVETAKMLRAWEQTESRVEKLNEALEFSNSHFERMHQETGDAFNGMISRFSGQASAQTELMQQGHGLATEMLHALEIARRGQIEAFAETSEGLRSVREQLGNVDQNLTQIQQSQQAVHEGIAVMQANMSRLAHSAQGVYNTLEEASDKIKDLTVLFFISDYWPYLAILFFMLLVVATGHKSGAAGSGVLIVLVIAIFKSGLASKLRQLSLQGTDGVLTLVALITDNVPPWGIFSILFMLSLGLVYLLVRNSVLTNYEGFLLPSIEIPQQDPIRPEVRKWTV